MKTRTILRRGAITLGATAAAIGSTRLSAATAQAQPSTHAHHSALIMPQPGDGSGDPPFSAAHTTTRSSCRSRATVERRSVR